MSGDLTLVESPNASCPELSSLVRIGSDAKRGRFIEALEYIPRGTVVCREKGIALGIDPKLCCYCLSPLETSLPHCGACKAVHEELVGFEEPVRRELQELGLAGLTVRVLLRHSVKEIEDCLEGRGVANKFTPVMELKKGPMDLDFSIITGFLDRFEGILKTHPHWSVAPEGLFRRAFKEIFSRLTINAHTVYSVAKTCSPREEMPCGVGLFPISSIFNHSCESNVFSFFLNNTFIFVSRGVAKGEELVDSYGIQAHSASLKQREEFLAGRGFKCICKACESTEIDHLFEENEKFEFSSLTTLSDVREAIASGSLDEGHIELHDFLADKIKNGHLGDAIDCLKMTQANEFLRGIVSEPHIANQYLLIAARFADSESHRRLLLDLVRCALLMILHLYCNAHPVYEPAIHFLREFKRVNGEEGEELKLSARRLKESIDTLFS